MIPKQLASKLLMIVNNKQLIDVLNEYCDYRISDLKEKLSTAELSEVQKLQASIKELRRFETLRDEVLEVGKQ